MWRGKRRSFRRSVPLRAYSLSPTSSVKRHRRLKLNGCTSSIADEQSADDVVVDDYSRSSCPHHINRRAKLNDSRKGTVELCFILFAVLCSRLSVSLLSVISTFSILYFLVQFLIYFSFLLTADHIVHHIDIYLSFRYAGQYSDTTHQFCMQNNPGKF